MAMDENRMGTNINTAVEEFAHLLEQMTPAQREELWQVIAKAVVDEIRNNGVVTVTGVSAGVSTAIGTIS